MIKQIAPAAAYKPSVGQKGQDLINNILHDKTGKYCYENKLDGSRYLAHIMETGITFTSRRISDVTGKYSEYAGGKLQHLNVVVAGYAETILDGELMATSAAAMKEGSYQVFDILFYKGKDLRNLSLRERLIYRRKVIIAIKNQYPDVDIHEVETIPILDAKLTQEAYKKYVAAGGEGFILKNMDSKYLTGSRSKEMFIKWKKSETFDVIIQGFEISESLKYGPSGLSTFRHLYGYQFDENKKLILVSNIPATSFTDIQHIEMKKQGLDQLNGKIAEIEGMGRASKNIKIRHPRFIRWRTDKNIEDCQID